MTPKRTFFLQYTLTLMNKPHGDQLVTQIGVADITSRKRFFQAPLEHVCVNSITGRVKTPTSDLIVSHKDYSMSMDCQASDFGFKINLKSSKGPIWYADNGVLVMGNPSEPEQKSIHYTFTEMATDGYLYFHGEGGKEIKIAITGSTWFDKQCGPYNYTSITPMWEWFSIRFFNQ